MTALRVQVEPNAPLSFRVTDVFQNVVELRVVGPSGDLSPKPANFVGGYIIMMMNQAALRPPPEQFQILQAHSI
jgi:hypothetical protein